MHVGLLDDGGQRLLGEAARLQKAGEVAALPQLGDAQLDAARAGLPGPVAVAVALSEPLRALLPIGGAGQRADLQLHHALGGEADHLAQDVGVGGLLHERAKVHYFVGHRQFLGCVGVSQPDPTGESSMTTASRSLACMGRLLSSQIWNCLLVRPVDDRLLVPTCRLARRRAQRSSRVAAGHREATCA